VYANESATPLPHEWYSSVNELQYLQYTEFADLSFDLTPRWNVEGGVQHFQSKFNGGSEWASYAWQPKEPSESSGGSHKFNFKAGTNYKLTDKVMLYGIFSQGFRDGGVNGGLGPRAWRTVRRPSSSPTRSTISRSAGSRRCSTAA